MHTCWQPGCKAALWPAPIARLRSLVTARSRVWGQPRFPPPGVFLGSLAMQSDQGGHEMRIKVLSVALALAAVVAPVAHAHHAPSEEARTSAPAPATVVKVVQRAGFNWDD